MKLNKSMLVTVFIIVVAALLIYLNFSDSLSTVQTVDEKISVVDNETEQVNWQDTELIDVRSGEKFKISDFKGKPILLESFAVWCPTCLKQQKEIKKIAAEQGDKIIHISLDTDPNEDVTKVLDHVTRNDFDWYYTISPIEMTRELTKVFGLTFVNAPSAPVVLICPDQSYRFLKNGVKKSAKLLEEIERGCEG